MQLFAKRTDVVVRMLLLPGAILIAAVFLSCNIFSFEAILMHIAMTFGKMIHLTAIGTVAMCQNLGETERMQPHCKYNEAYCERS